MPQVPVATSLVGACLRNIARNMDSLWCADYIENFLDQGQFVHVVGPFETLPPPLVQALLETLCRLNTLKRHHLHLLLNSNLKFLNLSALRPVANTNPIIRLVNLRCSDLTELDLSDCKQVTAQVLCESADSFHNIAKLNLTRTKCSDQVLTILAHRCFNIRELKVSGCPVTDNGMVNLCATFPGDQVKMPRLVRLDIDHTLVGVRGATEAVSNLPNLQWLTHPMVCLALHHLNTGNSTDKQFKLLNLEYFPSDGQSLTGQSLENCIMTACVMSPKATSVKFNGETDAVCSAVSTLTNLISLELFEEKYTTIDRSILSLLQLRGENIHFLHFGEVDMVDLEVVGVLCPELRHLTLTYNQNEATFLPNTNPGLVKQCRHRPFSKLGELQLLVYTAATMFPDDLSTVLSYMTRLRKLTVAGLGAITDDVIHNVLKVNPLHHLEVLELSECNEITGEAILAVLEADNALTDVSLLHCRDITRADFDEYKRLIKQKNYLVSVKWE